MFLGELEIEDNIEITIFIICPATPINMGDLINVREFLENNFADWATWTKFIELPNSEIPGVVLKDGEIYLTHYNPGADFLYHMGFFRGFKPGFEFDNLENLKWGYFGNPKGLTYLAIDNQVKPSRPLMDLELKIDAKKLGPVLYRDPETFLVKYSYEWGRSFMIEGAIPRNAIVGISFHKVARFVPELRRDGDVILAIEETFERIRRFREDFKRELGFQETDITCSEFAF